jgi:hypothetical protein
MRWVRWIFSGIIAVATIVFTLLRWAVDYTGRTTFFEDYEALSGRISLVLTWLQQIPGIGFYTGVAVAFATALLLVVWDAKRFLAEEPQAPDQSVVDIRSDIRRLMEAANSHYVFDEKLEACIDRLDASNHPMWLAQGLEDSRRAFLHMARIVRAVRGDHGPGMGDDEMREEMLSQLRKHAHRLEVGIAQATSAG